jgi:hypothetical protein
MSIEEHAQNEAKKAIPAQINSRTKRPCDTAKDRSLDCKIMHLTCSTSIPMVARLKPKALNSGNEGQE